MVERERMIDMIGNKYYSSEDFTVIDGVRYKVEDLTYGETTLNEGIYHFASIHDQNGGLKTILLYLNDGWICTEFACNNYRDSITMSEYILKIPNISELFNGDELIIADVKRVIRAFIYNKLVFDEMMDASITRLSPKKA